MNTLFGIRLPILWSKMAIFTVQWLGKKYLYPYSVQSESSEEELALMSMFYLHSCIFVCTKSALQIFLYTHSHQPGVVNERLVLCYSLKAWLRLSRALSENEMRSDPQSSSRSFDWPTVAVCCMLVLPSAVHTSRQKESKSRSELNSWPITPS